jgi:hypothetical protein
MTAYRPTGNLQCQGPLFPSKYSEGSERGIKRLSQISCAQGWFNRSSKDWGTGEVGSWKLAVEVEWRMIRAS